MKPVDYLLELNRRGLVHAPDESENAFFIRCNHSSPLKESVSSSLAMQLFDINPDWVAVQNQSKGLRLWEGGCTWVEEGHVTIQLHPTFQKKGRYFGYEREEIIAHELVHVARSSFEEPIFEEILAYQTSPSPLRRYWGPIIRNPRETVVTIISLIGCSLLAFFEALLWAACIALFGLIVGGIFRLVRTQRIFSSALKKIRAIVGPENSLAVMLRLTDREIIRFSKMSSQEIAAYASKMSKFHIRWQQIKAAYFGSSSQAPPSP